MWAARCPYGRSSRADGTGRGHDSGARAAVVLWTALYPPGPLSPGAGERGSELGGRAGQGGVAEVTDLRGLNMDLEREGTRWESAAQYRGVRRASSEMVQFARQLRQDATPSERKLWAAIRRPKLGPIVFRRQAPIGPYVVDFHCSAARLVVEVDGEVHDTRTEADEERQRQLERMGLRVLRVTAAEVERDCPAVVRRMLSFLDGS